MSWMDAMLLASVALWAGLALRFLGRKKRRGCCGCCRDCGQGCGRPRDATEP